MRHISASLQPVPMPDSDRAEELSVAYACAIAAHAGINTTISRKDFGIDISFRRVWKRRSDNHYTDMPGLSIPSQLKSARAPEWKFRAGKIVYDLRAKNYNDLVTSTNGFLILMCLPSSIDEWLLQGEECLHLYKCCYYWIPGLEDIETPNKHTKTIYIPREQLFTVGALTTLVDQVQLGITP